MSSKKKRAIILDMMNVFSRSFAVDPTIAEDGAHIGGLMGSIKQLQRCVREMKPDLVIAAWDGEGGSKKRRSINKNYKEGRKRVIREGYNRVVEQPMSEEEAEKNRQWQLLRLVVYLNKMPVRQFMFDHVEADDVIAACCQSNALRGWEKIIISSDKDFYQLLDEETIIHRPTQKEYINYKKVQEKHNIHPQNMTVARAIAGDSSDNLDGIRGVGLKTAAKCFPELSEADSVMLDDVFEACKEKEGELKAYGKILEGKDRVKQNYQIMQLYNPKISFDATKKIEKELKHTSDLGFDKKQFKVMLTEDGFPSYNWSDLKMRFRKMTVDSINKVFE